MIKVNEQAIKNRIQTEVDRIIAECQEAADKGFQRHYVTTDRDIYRDVLDELEKDKISVIVRMFRHGPSERDISHHGNLTSLGLVWY